MIRQIVEIAANKHVTDSIRVRSTNLPTSLRVYGNLLNTSSGYRITRQYGIELNIQGRGVDNDPSINEDYGFISNSAKRERNIVVVDLIGYGKDMDISSVDVLEYDIQLEGRVLYSIFVVLRKGDTTQFPVSGNFDCLKLEKEYDSKYNKLADYFS